MTSPDTHGTITAYDRHRKSGEQPCEECRATWNAYLRARRKSHPPTAEQKAAQNTYNANWKANNPDAYQANRLRQKARERAMRRLAKEYEDRFEELVAEELAP